MNDGFTLINVTSISGSPDQLFVDMGMVDHVPKIEWKYEKVNPLNPKETWRDGKYHRDELTLTLTGSFAQYQALTAFLSEADPVDIETGLGLYVHFLDGDNSAHCYPIDEVSDLGEVPHGARLWNSVYEIRLISIYDDQPHLPAFLNFGDGDFGAGGFGY